MNATALSPATRRRRVLAALIVLVLMVLITLLTALAVQQSWAAASTVSGQSSSAVTGESVPRSAPTGSVIAPSEADGVIRDGDQPSVFDEDRAAVGNLDRDLLDALQRAATDAASDGVDFVVNSGWRSTELQQHMLQDAVAEYGSKEEAARWVATAETSSHVTGEAIDIGPLRAQDWLAQHGAGYGLCQTYGNEPWHYELRTDAVDNGCPQPYADPTEDPRLQG